MSEPVSVGLAAILEIRNAALDHKKTCDHNCNVSLGGLKRAAELLVGHCYASELPQARKWIADMPIIAAFLAVLLLAAPVYAQPSKFGLSEATVIAANAADLGSTIYALHHGAREANPMLGSKLASIAPLKVLGAAAQVLTVRRLKASGHPTAAKITTVFIGSLYLAVSVHNVKVGMR